MESLNPLSLKEAYEVLEAIDEKNSEAVKKNSATCSFRLYLCQIAKEKGEFEMSDSSKRSAGR